MIKIKMVKKKKRKGTYQPTTNKFWSNIVQSYPDNPPYQRGNVATPQQPGSSTFQTPDHQQEGMVDLTDDTSPKNPNKQSQQSNRETQQKREEVQSESPVVSGSNPTAPSKQDDNTSCDQTPNEQGKGVPCEKKEVVEGFASDIKFSSSKTVTVEKKSDTPPVTKKDVPNYYKGKPPAKPSTAFGTLYVLGTKAINSRVTRSFPSVNRTLLNPKPQQNRMPRPQQTPTRFPNPPRAPLLTTPTTGNTGFQNTPQPLMGITIPPMGNIGFSNPPKPAPLISVPPTGHLVNLTQPTKPPGKPQEPTVTDDVTTDGQPGKRRRRRRKKRPDVPAENPATEPEPKPPVTKTEAGPSWSKIKPAQPSVSGPSQRQTPAIASQPKTPVPDSQRQMPVPASQPQMPVPAIQPHTPVPAIQPQTPVWHTLASQPYYDPYGYSYPKGIPKSFLMRPQDPTTPQPYFNMTANMPDPNAQSWQQQPQMGTAPTLAPTFTPTLAPMTNMQSGYDYNTNTPATEETENQAFMNIAEDPTLEKQPYSPSDAYADSVLGASMEDEREGSESPELLEPGQKRLSAFQRLGPLTQPKKPKMTINLMCNKDQSVREVVDETEKKYVPVHLREDIINSTDETVQQYLKLWPWEKGLPVRKTVMPRSSKSVMILEHEQMEEFYEKEWMYVQITVQGYPPEWTKEKLLDTVMDAVNGKSFIPLYIEFSPQACKFLVIRCRAALNALHKAGLIVRKDGAELAISISQTSLNTTRNDFLPKLVLRKRLAMRYDGERRLDLSEFTTKEDISHFIYFPLNRATNQADLLQYKSNVMWDYLTELNLSRNRITSIDSFNLPSTTPKLQHLDLSHNWIEKPTVLLRCRELNLRSLKLEGNPLCHDYTDPEHYVKVLRMMFPTLTEIDGEKIKLHGEMPTFKKNYCPPEAEGIIEKFLEVFFPLLDAPDRDRSPIEELYHEKATMTITYRFKLRYGQIYRQFRTLFNYSRVLEEGDTDAVQGAADVTRLVNKWPPMEHDPSTFTVDVVHHDDFLTIFKVAGILKLTAETLAEDEHLLSFARTIALHSPDGVDYKITNEMVYWDQPTEEYADRAFQITTVRQKRLSLKLESPPDEDLKEKLLAIFMQLTELNKDASEKCLEHKDWNLKLAIEYFMKLVKLDEIEILTKGIK